MSTIAELSTLGTASWLTCFSDNANGLYVSESTNLYRTTDNGINFTTINVYPYYIEGAVFSNTNILYAVAYSYNTYTTCIIKSEDYGQTWVPIYDSESIASYISDPVMSNNGYAYFILDAQIIVYRESDGSISKPVLSAQARSIGVDIDNNVYIGVINDSLYKSTDNGITFSTLSSDSRKWTMIVSDNSGNVYAGASDNDYIYKSTDGGITWNQSSSMPSPYWYKGIIKDDGSILVSSDGHIVESIDGNTWSNVAGSLVRSWKDIAANNSGLVIAIVEGSSPAYKIPLPAVAAPTSDIKSGIYQESVLVSLSCSTLGSTIYYTLDGSEPSNSSTEYTSLIGISSDTKIRAISYKSGYDASKISTFIYKIASDVACEDPVIYFSVLSGGNTNIEINSITADSTIYYTLDGSDPTDTSNTYSGTFSVPYDTIVKAVAKKEFYQDSNIPSATYILGEHPRKSYELFNYELGYGVVGVPSYIYGGGGALIENNRITVQNGSKVTKYSPSQDSEYNGNYVLKFLLDTRHANNGMIFSVFSYASSSYIQAIKKVNEGVVLGWAAEAWYVADILTSVYDESVRGDFNGTQINEDGEYTIIYIKKTGEPDSDVMMRIISPSGLSYSSGWATIDTPDKKIEIGTFNSNGLGKYSIGPITSYDFVDEQFIDYMRYITICSPPALTPESSTQGGSAYISMSTYMSGSDIYYTFDNIPSRYSDLYNNAFTILDSKSINSIAINRRFEDSPINVSKYIIVFGGPIEIVEPWSDNGSWQFSNEVMMSDGNLVIDTSMYGSVAANMYSVGEFSNISNNKTFPCYCIELDVDSTGSFRFGAHPAIAEFISNTRSIEFNYDGSNTSFFIRGTPLSGFDGNSYINSSKFKIRAAIETISTSYPPLNVFRLSVCSQDGELISDTGWLGRAGSSDQITDNDSRTLYPYNVHSYNSSQATGCLGMYWQNGSRSSSNITMAMSILSGTFSAAPYKTISNCTTYAAEMFLLTGFINKNPIPSNPVVNITEHSSGMYNITITPDEHSKVIATINEGSYVNNIYDLITNHRLIVSEETGAPIIINIADPCVLRVATYNGITSDMSEIYVGKDTEVQIPEISPRFGAIEAGSSLPIKMHCSNANAVIRYTTDGSEPTETSTVYQGTIFLRDTTTIKAKSFYNGQSSIVKYGYFWNEFRNFYDDLIICEDIHDVFDHKIWNYDDNATFSSDSIEVHGNSPIGVSLRSDILPIHKKSPSQELTIVGFRVNSNFRLKFPGYDKHFAWIGNNIGKVQNTTDTPGISIDGAISLSIALYIAEGITKIIKVIPIDADGENMEPVLITYDEPTGLSFTSEGVDSYSINELQVLITNATYYGYVWGEVSIPDRPWDIPGRPIITSQNGRNLAGTQILIQPTYSSDDIRSTVAKSEGASSSISYDHNIQDTEINILSNNDTARAQLTVFEYNSTGLAKASTLVGYAGKIISNIGSWDINRSSNISDIYVVNDYGVSLSNEVMIDGQSSVMVKVSNNPQIIPSLPLDFIHQYKDYIFEYPFSDMDTGNAFFRFDTPDLNNIDGWPDLIISCGWGIPGIPEIVKVIDVTDNSQSTRLAELIQHSTAPVSYVSIYNTSTWTESTYDKKYVAAHDGLTWHCGRKVNGGKLYVRTIIKDKFVLNRILLDTGWVDAGNIPTKLPRPQITIRMRRVQRCNNTIGSTRGYFVRGMSNVSEEQLDRYMSNGTIKNINMPYITDVSGTNISSYSAGGHPEMNDYVLIDWPLSNTNNLSSDALYIRSGSEYINIRSTSFSNGFDSYDEGVLSRDTYYSGYNMGVPSISNMVAYNLYDKIKDGDMYVYEGFSDPLNVYMSHNTSDYVTVDTSIPKHVYIQFNKKQLPVVQSINNVPTYWKITFSDGYEYTINALISDDIERVLDPGIYTVKFTRYGSDGTESVLGETIPEQFIVSNNISLSTVAPTSVLPDVNSEFLSNANGSTDIKYLWTFSDGYTSAEQNVTRTFNKSGRYKWELNVIDPAGDSARASGHFIVVFSTSLPGSLLKIQEARIS